jgi:tetratricopeptide (TPR) repeat protein
MRLDEALDLVRRAMKLKPDNGYITDSLGWVHYKRGNLERALVELLRANILSPGESVILEHIGDVYRARGDKDRALQSYREALRFNPDRKTQAEIEERLKELGASAQADGQ